jgi:hypothetical protein
MVLALKEEICVTVKVVTEESLTPGTWEIVSETPEKYVIRQH